MTLEEAQQKVKKLKGDASTFDGHMNDLEKGRTDQLEEAINLLAHMMSECKELDEFFASR